MPFQEGTKAQGFVKYSANEFAKGHNHINEIVNFFTSCYALVTVSKSLQSLK